MSALDDVLDGVVDIVTDELRAELAKLLSDFEDTSYELTRQENENLRLRAELDKVKSENKRLIEYVGNENDEAIKTSALIDHFRAELDKMQAKAVEYALIVEQFQKLLGVYTTTSAFEKIAELENALDEARNLLAASVPWVEQWVGIASSARGLPEEITAWLTAHPAKDGGA